MHHIHRRLSPSLILAAIALFVALAGTAIADGVIVSSPDQLGPNVVTAGKIAEDAVDTGELRDKSVLQIDQAHPHIRVRVGATGTAIGGDAATITRAGTGSYKLEFNPQLKLGQPNLDHCTPIVTPEFHIDLGTGHDDHHRLRAYSNLAASSTFVQVFTYEQGLDGRETPVNAAFDVALAC